MTTCEYKTTCKLYDTYCDEGYVEICPERKRVNSQQVTGSSNTPRAEVISSKLPDALLIPADIPFREHKYSDPLENEDLIFIGSTFPAALRGGWQDYR